VWDHKTVAVYVIDSQDGQTSVEPAGSFSSATRFVCLFRLNVYTVEPGRIHVRNFQVRDAAATLLFYLFIYLFIIKSRT